MRSYYEHLTTAAPQSAGPISPKPTFRSSAIFPAFRTYEISSRIIFLGYWMLKRRIQQLSAVVTLRALDGMVLARQNMIINEAKSYNIELDDLLKSASLPIDQAFTGSLEIEFYASESLVFPYPAVVINYYGPSFSSVVHTAQRIYNDYDDLQKNAQTQVPESGFNLYADADREPFISLINGPMPVSLGIVEFEFFNSKGEKQLSTKVLGPLAPYETIVIYPASEFCLQEFFAGNVGFCKAKFNVNWIFPRLLVGNLCRQPRALSITHTYYDCVEAVSDSDYWIKATRQWHNASLMVPVISGNGHFTNIYFYPIYSASQLSIDVEIYGSDGSLKGKKTKAIIIESPSNDLKVLKLKDLCQNLNIVEEPHLAARLIASPIKGSRIPARIKLGLDLGRIDLGLPCNICTNLQPFNPRLEGKSHSFKWAPFLADQPAPSLWLMNSSPKKKYNEKATIELSFYREKDTTAIYRTLELAPQGFIVLDAAKDPELMEFFAGSIGWCTVVTNNPYLTTYYFTESSAGIIGGDHGF